MSTGFNKTQQSTPIGMQDVPTNTTIISSNINVATKGAAAFSIKLGRESGSAFTAGWPNVRIEADGGDGFIPLYTYQMQLGASLANTTLNAQANTNDTSIAVNSASNISAGDVLFIGASGAGSYEIVRVKAVVSSTVYLEEALRQVHAVNSQVTDQGEMAFPALDVTPYQTLRVVIDNANSGQTIAAEVGCVTFDSMG